MKLLLTSASLVSLSVLHLRPYRLFALSLLMAAGLSMNNLAGASVTEQPLTLQGNGAAVHAVKWEDPIVKTQAVLVAIHGGVQNARNYTAFAKELAGKGIITYSIDLRGHGEWLIQSKTRSELNYNASTRDVVSLAGQLRAEHPELPIFCIGESLGASTALNASVLQPKLFDGLILVSPGTSPSGIHVKPILASVIQGIGSLGTNISLLPHITEISEDQRSCDEMINDQRTRRSANVGELLHMAKFVRNNKALAPKLDPGTPLLVMYGDKDQICSPASITRLYGDFRSADKSIEVIAGCGHLLVTTKYLKPHIVAIVADWLAGHAKGTRKAMTISSSAHLHELESE